MSDNNKLLARQIEFWHGNLKSGLMKAFELTPEDKLDWMPTEEMIPLGKVFLHICETSGWWYGDIMKGKAFTELAVAGQKCPSKDEIARQLDAHWDRLEQFFADPPDVLDRVYTREGEDNGKPYKIEYNGLTIFTHILQHDIHHRSQIFQYLRILGIKPRGV